MQFLRNLLPPLEVFLILLIETRCLHHVTAKHDGGTRRFQGRYSRNVRSYEITIPRKVHPDGTFKSFSLPHFYERNYDSRRLKRSEEAAKDEDVVHYALNFNDRLHHVELQPNHGLISPGMIVERKRGVGDLTDVELRSVNETQCHYHGKVRGDPHSRVALSVCDGLAGHITSSDGRFFVEPVSDASPEGDGRHLHMVHRHVPTETIVPAPKCATKDDWQNAWMDRYRYEYKNGSTWSGEFRRSVSSHYYLELCVVADKKFLDHHREGDVETYILTIMNMVSDFYHDATIGNLIDVVVVRIVMLEREKKEVDLTISQNAEKTLKSFSTWAKRMNPSSHQHPNHHDIAVLLTKHDLCSDNDKCSLLGLAYVATACNPDSAACINEDKGLLLAITVTHEIGHVMGCSHDTEEISGCKPLAPDESGHVMSPFVMAHTTIWSACSKRFVTDYLDNGLGQCLLDEPPDQPFKRPQMPLGAMYDGDHQCRILFGDTSKLCPTHTFDCKQLWCETSPKRCGSNLSPPADGTSCGTGKWCYNTECVRIGQRPGAVNGGWGEWGSWSPCSRTCGTGVSWQERSCNNPTPRHLGRYCIGQRRNYKTCNTKPCSSRAIPFREKQCKDRNLKPFNGKYYKWKTFVKDDGNPCTLTCINQENVYAVLEPRVKDGTPCKPGTRDLCIAGVCRHIGCDWELDSEAEFDQCGICRGTGAECDHIKGTYKKKGHDYVQVIKIPRESHNVHIMERAPSENTIAVSAKNGKKFYLNGNHQEQLDGQYTFGKDTLGIYSHPETDKEELKIFGPTTEELILYVAFYSSNEYPGLDYEYWRKKTRRDVPSPGSYKWEFLEWEECTVRCGGGSQISEAACVEEKGGEVSSSYCHGIPKPKPDSRTCNEKPCAMHWSVGEWCTCKDGSHSRDVRCVMEAPHWNDDDIEVPEEKCKEKKPCSSEKCDEKAEKPCPATKSMIKTCPDENTTPCTEESNPEDSSEDASASAAAAESDASKASAAESDASKASAAESEPCKTAATEGEVSKASAAESEASKASAAESSPCKTAATESEASKASAAESEASKASAAESEASKASAAESEPCKAAAPESEVSKAAAPESEVSKAAAPESEVSKVSAAECDVSKTDAAESEASKTQTCAANSAADNAAEANSDASSEACSVNKDIVTKTRPCNTVSSPDVGTLFVSVGDQNINLATLAPTDSEKKLNEENLPLIGEQNTNTLDLANNASLTLATRDDKQNMYSIASPVPADKTAELIKEIDETLKFFKQDGMLPISIKVDSNTQVTPYCGLKDDKMLTLLPKQGRSTDIIDDIKIIPKVTNDWDVNQNFNNEAVFGIEVTSIESETIVPLESADKDIQSLVAGSESLSADLNKNPQDLTNGVTFQPSDFFSLLEGDSVESNLLSREKGIKESFGIDDLATGEKEQNSELKETDSDSSTVHKSKKHTSTFNGQESFQLFPKDDVEPKSTRHATKRQKHHKSHAHNKLSHPEDETSVRKRSKKAKKHKSSKSRPKSNKLKRKNNAVKRKLDSSDRKADKETAPNTDTDPGKIQRKSADDEDSGDGKHCANKTTDDKSKDHKLKPNEEVEDRQPPDTLTVIEVPIVEVDETKCNKSRVLSDEAEEEMGDPESVILDTKHKKIYHGKEAVDKIKQIEKEAGKKN